jgi:glycogen(starch) synthase
MRVLMASRGVVPIFKGCGGAELAAYQLAKATAQDGHEVDLLGEVQEDDFPPVAGLAFVQVRSRLVSLLRRLPGIFPVWILQHLIGNVAVAVAVRRRLRSGHYDLVHLHGNLSTILVSLGTRIPIVYTEHDATPWSCRYRRWWERGIRKAIYRTLNVAAYRRATTVVATCAPLAEDIVARWNVPRERVLAIVNGADPEVFGDRAAPVAGAPSPAKPPFDRYALFVGRLTPRKAPDLVLQALVEEEDVSCVFVGDGPMRAKLERLTDELGLRDRVAFLGLKTPAELADIYNRAEFLVLPSVSESMPLVIVEAMASGVPVLATRISGAPNLIKDWETGFLLKPGDVGQLAMAMRFLWGDEALRRKMGTIASKRVQQSLLWPEIARQYAGVYRRVAAEAPVAPLARPVPALHP